MACDTVTVDTLFVDLSRGDRLLLCTDGVHTQMNNEGQLGDLLREGTPTAAAGHLVRHSLRSGSDNATALVVEICDRLVKRAVEDRGLVAADLERARQSVLLVNLSLPEVLNALSAAVQVELQPGSPVPRALASDKVAYIVLDGVVCMSNARRVGIGALLFPESLVGVFHDTSELPVVEERVRLLRLRADDFDEVCSGDAALAAELYKRLALHLARLGARAPREGSAGGAGGAGGPE